MRLRPIYNRHGWVLCECAVCGRTNYVEPHGTTAQCCMPDWTEHSSIDYQDRVRTLSGEFVPVNRRGCIIHAQDV